MKPETTMRPEPGNGTSSDFSFERVEAPTLKGRVAAQIRSAILNGDVRPGERVVESRLAKQMSVAQNTVREALQELEAQGLMVKFVNRETQVRKLTIEGLENLFRVRMELEGLAMELAHPQVNEQSLLPLVRSVEQMRISARTNSITEFYRLDIDFHKRLWALAKNDFLDRALTPLSIGPIAFVLVGSRTPLELDYSATAEDHAEITDALRKGTPEEARRMMQWKIQSWYDLQMRWLREVTEAEGSGR